ncbi:MAG TPA: hypothetical protein VNY32_07250 [Candidatus Acidoferrales bacterium]|jgi:hypothetical protein|nr:hypothetical protein [Candidatus Acidoferrales bacterium]
MNAHRKMNWMKLTVVAAGLLLPGMAHACTYQLSYSYTPVAATGGSAAVQIYTQPGCAWSVSEGFGWLAVTSAKRGTGSAAVGFYVAPNSARSARTGWINGFPGLVSGSGADCFSRSSQGGCQPPPGPTFRLTIAQHGR